MAERGLGWLWGWDRRYMVRWDGMGRMGWDWFMTMIAERCDNSTMSLL